MKKIFIFIFIGFLITSRTKAQYADVSFELETMITQAFPGQVSGVFNGLLQMDTTSPFVTTLRHMDIRGLNQNTGFELFGLQYFDALEYLNCADNSITGLGPLPPGLDTLICSAQISGDFIDPFCLHSLSTLPGSLQYLDCSGNGLYSLPALPAGMLWLNCASNLQAIGAGFSYIPTLTSLPVLPGSLKYLNCSGNGITTLPELPSSLIKLNCSGNTYIYDDGNGSPFEVPGLVTLPALPASLTLVDASYNSITQLPALPGSLDSLRIHGNPINCLPHLPLSLTYLSINNTNISCVPNLVPGLTTDISRPVCNSINNPNGCPVEQVTTALLTAGPDINNLFSNGTEPSNSASYFLSGTNLSPATGNITVVPSFYLEVSLDNVNFSHSNLLIPYSGGQLSSTTIYVRIAPQGTSGPITDSIEHYIVGGGGGYAVVHVGGLVARMYYNTKANLGLNNPGTWSSTPNGLGTSPGSLSDDAAFFNIINQQNANYTGTLAVSGNNSKIIVGDGITPISFTIPAAAGNEVSAATKIDVSNNAILKILNKNLPTIGVTSTGSTVDFAQTGTSVTDTVKIPLRTYYNLKLTGGLKYFNLDTTKIEHEFVADGVVSLGGALNQYFVSTNQPDLVSRVRCMGDVSFLNGTSIDPGAGQYPFTNCSFELFMKKPSGIQTITTNGTDLRLISLRGYTSSIVLSPNTNLILGSYFGGGLSLASPTAKLSMTDGKITCRYGATLSAMHDSGRIDCHGTSLEMLNTYPANNGLVLEYGYGTVRFEPGSILQDIFLNYQYPVPVTNDHFVKFKDSVAVAGVVTLKSGYIGVLPGAVLHFDPSATVAPGTGSERSLISGAVSRTGTTAFTFPIGYNVSNYIYGYTRYAPLDFSNYNGSDMYTAEYQQTAFPSDAIDPVTLAQFPQYQVSEHEFWNITPATPGGSVDISFHYTNSKSGILNPLSVRMAHFDSVDWNDIGGLPDPLNTIDSGKVSVTGVSQFSPFTFSATMTGVVPVKLSIFNVRKHDKTVQLFWTTEQETNSKEFIIERSADQNKWNQLSRVNAAGNSAQKINYSATDFTPAKGINYYRLKQIDLDGRFTYSEIRSVYFGKDGNVWIAPNPANDKVTVYLPGNTEVVSIIFYNANGQVIKTVSSTEEAIEINITGLSKGIYPVKIAGRNFSDVKKMVVY